MDNLFSFLIPKCTTGKFNKLYNESYQLMNQIIGFRNQLKD
ncbi:hypothetical protein SAMN05660493_03276 [Epilithonimonas bovis DSM 19482]|uniref:Uncharacterized protein n=1 Tax=Epilithonimonas bovis DSM 19482 TaxID=1121284 RepID=A0A1U7Q093_9FLAO|nr:hypothetical protein SAMN05660493_03276 [Epilithonimonas bovis DSM 19482]